MATPPIARQTRGFAFPACRRSLRRDDPIEHVLELIGKRDVSALGELYDRLGGLAFRAAYLVLVDKRLAEEVVRDVFLSIWSTAAVDVERPVAAWVLSVVHRRALVQRSAAS